MEGTSPRQRGQEGRRERLWSSIFRVRTPGAAGAGGWQSLGHGWRAYTLGPDADPWEHSMGSERTREARRSEERDGARSETKVFGFVLEY